MKRLAVFPVMGLMALLSLTGCGGGGDDDSESASELLPGTWRAIRLEAAGHSTACAGALNFMENGEEVSISCGANDTLTFYENGAFTASSTEEGAYAGTWQSSGDSLTVTITTPSVSAGTETERIDFSDDNTFTTETEDGTTITFVRQ